MAVAAKDLMLKGVSLHVKDNGTALVRILSGRHRALPVVNDDWKVVGIVTKARVLKALREEKTIFRCTAGSLMTCGHLEHDSCGSPLTVSLDTPMQDVLKTMHRERMSTIPVVKEGVLVGVITTLPLPLWL